MTCLQGRASHGCSCKIWQPHTENSRTWPWYEDSLELSRAAAGRGWSHGLSEKALDSCLRGFAGEGNSLRLISQPGCEASLVFMSGPFKNIQWQTDLWSFVPHESQAPCSILEPTGRLQLNPSAALPSLQQCRLTLSAAWDLQTSKMILVGFTNSGFARANGRSHAYRNMPETSQMRQLIVKYDSCL